MTKQISYAISQRFQWFFIVVGGLAYVASVIPYVYILLQGRGTFDSVANTTLLVGTMGMPLLVGAGAAALTRRRGLGRAWVATGAAFMSVVINELLIWIGSVLAPSLYELVNMIALVVAAVTVMAIVWIDRRQMYFGAGLRHWRMISVASIYAIVVVMYFVDAVRNVSVGSDGVALLLWPVAALSIFLSLTVFIFRHMPVKEYAKRVLLMVAVMVMTSMVIGGAMSIAQLDEMGWLTPDWSGFAALGATYVFGIWLLRSPVRVQAIRRK